MISLNIYNLAVVLSEQAVFTVSIELLELSVNELPYFCTNTSVYPFNNSILVCLLSSMRCLGG